MSEFRAAGLGADSSLEGLDPAPGLTGGALGSGHFFLIDKARPGGERIAHTYPSSTGASVRCFLQTR